MSRLTYILIFQSLSTLVYFTDVCADSLEQKIYEQVVPKKINTDEWKKIVGSRYEDTYTIQDGDTLWEVSHMLFGDAYLYNKVWALNNTQGISNPHIIEPGMLLRFAAGEEASMPRLVMGKKEMPLFSDEMVPTDNGGSIPSDLTFDSDGISPLKVQNEYPQILRVNTYLVENEVPTYAEITGSIKEGVFFAPNDIVYLNYDPNAPLAEGQTFSLFRYNGSVKNPYFKFQSIGENVEILGQIRILSINDERAEAVVTKAFGPITRGSYVTKYIPPLANLDLRYNPNLIKGTVVLGPQQNSTIFGQGDYLHINRGLVDGVELGNVFYVMRSEDGMSGYPGYMNKIPLAAFAIVDVQETTATGYITKSVQEVYLGDAVETIP